MSIYDRITPEQRRPEAAVRTAINLLAGSFGLCGIFAGAMLFNSGVNMTIEGYEKNYGSSIVRAEIQHRMDDRIDAMRDQFLAVTGKYPNGDKVISLNTGGESLLIDMEAVGQRMKDRYEGEKSARKVVGSMLGVLTGALFGLSVYSIRRDRRDMQAAAAKDASPPAPR